jgi:hypothetical protein
VIAISSECRSASSESPLEINIIRIFELPVPLATKLAEVRPIALFSFNHFKVRLGTEVFHFNLKRPQKIAA